LAHRKSILSYLVGLSLILAVSVLSGNDCYCDQGERSALIKAVKAYFEAEMAGDSQKVWEMLAPSSVFKRRYSYADYLEMMKGSRLSVKSYSVGRVFDIENNGDKKAMPNVEKMATVEVRVIMGGEGERETEHTSVLTFLKEGGKWYKG
jgi:hypothetical protein